MRVTDEMVEAAAVAYAACADNPDHGVYMPAFRDAITAALSHAAGQEADWRKHFTAEIVSDPPFPYGVAVVTNADGVQSVHTHGDDQVLWRFIAAIAASSGGA